MADSKRYVRPAALVVSALMAAVLAGCGGGSSSDDDTPPVTPPATPKTYVDSLVLPASAIKSVAANDVPAAQVAVFAIQLPAWDAAKSAETTVPGMAMQIGAARAVDALALRASAIDLGRKTLANLAGVGLALASALLTPSVTRSPIPAARSITSVRVGACHARLPFAFAAKGRMISNFAHDSA